MQKKVLVVDNSLVFLKLMHSLLETNGYHAIIAEDGVSALDIMRAYTPDIMFIDMIMPHIRGDKLCKIIRTMPHFDHIHLILLTAIAADAKHNIDSIGADYCIAKGPYDEMSQNIMSVLNKLGERTAEKQIEVLGANKLYPREITGELLTHIYHYESILGNMAEGIMTLNPNGKIIFANQAAFNYLGLSEGQILTSDFAGLFNTKQNQEIKAVIERCSQSVEPIIEEITVTRHDFYFALKIISIRFDKNLSNIIVMDDITDQQRVKLENEKLEAQLRQIQKMEAIGTLAGGIAHDFNNILASIMGYTELALNHAHQDTPLFSNLDNVFKASMRAKKLVEQILTFSRQEEGELIPGKLKHIIKEVLSFLKATLPAEIIIQKNIRSESIALINPTQIHQILMNLCTNAAHAMRISGGMLRVELTELELDEIYVDQQISLPAGNYIKLVINDTGQGMTPEIKSRIFEPFFTTKKQGEGTGMGLSMVHGIVSSHNGKISVYSEPGVGTTFNVFFPTLEDDMLPSKNESKPIPTGEERILIVEDETIIMEMLKQTLKLLGYKVLARCDAREALELFKNAPNNFDLVITDLNMPYLHGDKLALQLKTIRADIPVILCTGFSNKFNSDNLGQNGIDAFIMKPVIKRQIAEMIRELLDPPKGK